MSIIQDLSSTSMSYSSSGQTRLLDFIFLTSSVWVYLKISETSGIIRNGWKFDKTCLVAHYVPGGDPRHFSFQSNILSVVIMYEIFRIIKHRQFVKTDRIRNQRHLTSTGPALPGLNT